MKTNSESAAGSTGNLPVPPGYQPGGTGEVLFLSPAFPPSSERPSVPRGRLPRGTGQWPVLPKNLLALLAVWAFLIPLPAQAFPPAPPHTIYGLVRNEYGEPLYVTGAQIIFSTATNGVQVSSTIVPGLDPGVNYRLKIPMDSGIAPDNYKPTALKPFAPFLIRVKIGNTTYVPIQMSGSYANLGKPAASTRIDLTLGVDANNDGLPDAWQQLLLAMLGPDAKTGPNDDADGDGISNWNEYLAGTFAFDPADGFRLQLVPRPNDKPLLEFTVINPRTYTLFSSTNLQTWTPMSFKIPANGPADPSRTSFTATDIRPLQVEPQLPTDGTNANYFYKVQVQ